MDVILLHGQKRHNIKLALSEAESGDVLCVKHLAEAAQLATQVPISKQRLIFKGRSLVNHVEPLSNTGITNKSKVMLIGAKAGEPDPKDVAAIQAVTADVKKLESKLSEVGAKLDSYNKGFVAKNIVSEFLYGIEKSLLLVCEQAMCSMEALDDLHLDVACTTQRDQRKELVNRLQSLLDKADKDTETVKLCLEKLDKT